MEPQTGDGLFYPTCFLCRKNQDENAEPLHRSSYYLRGYSDFLNIKLLVNIVP